MGWIIGFAILWFVLRRSRRRMWTRRRARMARARMGLYAGGGWLVHEGGWGWDGGASGWGHGRRASMQVRGDGRLAHFDAGMRRAPARPPRESEFDALKRRYVSGELSDEQYEAELDVLFSTPAGRQQV